MFTSTLILAALIVFWYMLALFLIALARKDNSIVDVGWGLGFVLIALAAMWWNKPAGYLPVLATVLTVVWGLRLSAHVLLRNWGRAEDFRHAALRSRRGSWFPLHSFMRIFLLQGILMIVIALPVLWINTFGGHIGWLAIVGAIIWLKGFLWETVADSQLARFLKVPSNHGHVLKTGLWRLSRHPNYFGEVTQWWGLWLMALTVPGGWLTVLSPLAITFLITKVSGVPMLEAKQKSSPEFRKYARRTPALVPWLLHK